MKTEIQFRLRIRRGDEIIIGPGKIALLEAIAATGSISAAARALEMSYRRAWLLTDEMNRGLKLPVIEAKSGGSKGGGAALTPTAQEIITRYRAIEKVALETAQGDLDALLNMIAK
ncbi:winged helix-turn-helix domain-containing protein [Undibacterium terreum]|uniref:ModE family transcriptional regulator n=1 Tax=Undibacterium terreum TaxID=1224302 RepID=A0A916XHL1_9BURK|nr:LysR family transcriptional regulator [Undibacterium terreum]GGC74056.1 ModE family transcriptional regulator [Undibacterium terreum]